MKYLYTILITLLTYSFSYSQDTLYVVPEGAEPNYPNISAALDSANSGDIILVSSGNYSESILIDKSINILPLVNDGNFTISNNVTIYSNSGGEDEVFNIVISGATFTSNISQSTYINPNAKFFDISFIDCNVLGSLSLNSSVIRFSSYFSKFSNNISLKSIKELIGNEFINNTENIKSISIVSSAQNYLLNGHECKVYANNFLNYYISFSSHTNLDYQPSTFLFKNNFFRINISDSNLRGVFRFYQVPILSPIKIINNSFDLSLINWEGQLINASHTSSNDNNLTVYCESNIIFTDNSTKKLFNFGGGNDLLFVNNNLFNIDSISITDLFYLDQNGGYNLVEFSSNYNVDNELSLSIIDSVGTCLSNNCIDKGKNSIEYRDIDNTRNDLGTNGGPHSWSNYHNGSGPKVIDINIPSIIAPGMNISINGKGVNIND